MGCVKLLFSIVALLMVTSCTSEPKSPLRMGISLWPGYEPFFLARDMGHYETNTLSLVEYPSPRGVVRAMKSGTVDAAALTLDEVLALVSSDVKATVVMVTDISNGGDVVLAQPYITSIDQLRGKIVAFEPSILASYFLSRALDQEGMVLSDVVPVYFPIMEHLQVFESKRADAVVTFEPMRTQLINAGAVEIFSSADIPGEIVDVLVVRDRFIECCSSAVQQLIDGWYLALQHLKDNPKQAAAVMSRHLQISPEEVLASFNGIEIPSRKRVSEMLDPNTNMIIPVAERLQKTMIEQGLLRHEVNIKTLFSNQFLE